MFYSARHGSFYFVELNLAFSGIFNMLNRMLLIISITVSLSLNIFLLFRLSAMPGRLSGVDNASVFEAQLTKDEMEDMAHSEAIQAGSPTAPTVAVLFTDFQCAYCKRVAGNVEKIGPGGLRNSRIIIRELPIAKHPYAQKEAEVAICANKQSSEAAWSLYNYFYSQADQRLDLAPGAMKLLGSRSDIEPSVFQACLNSHDASVVVANDMALAKKYMVKSTPTLFVNGKSFTGSDASNAALQQLVDGQAK